MNRTVYDGAVNSVIVPILRSVVVAARSGATVRDLNDLMRMDMDMKSLVVEIHRLLRDRSWRLAAAESLTGGRFQSLMTSVSGASDVFVGGVTTYTIDQKVALLGVDRVAAESCNAVSEEVARAMVEGVCRMFGCKCAVATTGYAEANDEVAVPIAWIAVSINGDVSAERVESQGGRNEVQQIFAEHAAGLLRNKLARATNTN